MLKQIFTKIPVSMMFLSIFYFVFHLLGLLELPVFADEAIYTRWAQLFIDDPARYLFFPMNDGKTPLLFWLLAPFQFVFTNQLFAARFVSVCIGFLQMLVVMKIISLFTKNRGIVYLSGFIVSILPFWYFHHRMVLTDGLLTLFISLVIFFLSKEFVLKKSNTKQNLLLAGLAFGLAIYSKIPAVLCIPSFGLTVFLKEQKNIKQFIYSIFLVGVVIAIGATLFLLLAISPSFSQLFARGSDFLFPVSEVIAGKWKETIISFPVYVNYFITYMTPTFLLFSILGLFFKRNQTAVHVFFWSGVLFLIPIGILGKIVYARYLFPAVLFFTLSSVLGIDSFYHWVEEKSKSLKVKSFGLVTLVLLVSNTVAASSIFMVSSITDSSSIQFVSSDREQYLTKWSSGHGLYELTDSIRQEAQTSTIAVATEGSFGTLPDGLLLYFHNTNVDNIYIDGVGYPVTRITPAFAARAENFEKIWLVVNADRLQMTIDEKYLLTEYCRPFGAACLQIWDISQIIDTLVSE